MSPDGLQISSAHEHWSLAIHGIRDGVNKVIFETLDRPITLSIFSPDGSMFASVAMDSIINVWEASTGQLLKKFDNQLEGTTITFLAFSPDSTKIVFTCGDSSLQHVQMWHMKEDLVITIEDLDKAGVAAFFPSGIQLVTMSGTGAIRIWDITSNVPQQQLTLEDSVNSSREMARPYLLISSDSTRMVSSRYLWDIVNYQKLAEVSDPSAAMFTSNGHRVTLISERYGRTYVVTILDAITGASLYSDNYYEYAHISLTPTCLLCFDVYGGIEILDIESLSTPGPTIVQHLSCIYPPDQMMIRNPSWILK